MDIGFSPDLEVQQQPQQSATSATFLVGRLDNGDFLSTPERPGKPFSRLNVCSEIFTEGNEGNEGEQTIRVNHRGHRAHRAAEGQPKRPDLKLFLTTNGTEIFHRR